MNAAAPERSTPTEELSGLIERVTFFNEESGFCVLRVKVPGNREEVTVIDSTASVNAGEWLAAEGWWVRDKEHGLQFKAITIRTVPPKELPRVVPWSVILTERPLYREPRTLWGLFL